MIGYCFFNSLLTNKTSLHFLSNRTFLMRPILGNHVLNTLETKNGTFFTRTNFFVCDIFSGCDTWFDAYVEKLVPDQNEYFPANPQIPADLQKFANVRNWFRTL